jgi:Ca2+-binding EF-hand superfamily protein
MGCCQSRNITEKNAYEKIISNCHSVTKLRKLKAFDLDRISHRQSYNMEMSVIQFERMCKLLGISTENEILMSFFRRFTNENRNFCVRKITTLGILIGVASEIERIELLFRNYDDDATNQLSKDEIYHMLKDIFYICFDCLVELALNETSENERKILVRYKNELILIKKPLLNYYLKAFFEMHGEEINMKDFKLNFMHKAFRILLDPPELRIHSYTVYQDIMPHVAAVTKVIAQPGIIDQKILKMMESEAENETTVAR